MATTKAPGDRVAWTYTANDGTTFRVGAKDVYVNDVTDGVKYGGSAALASVRAKPASLKMRAVYCTTPAGETILVPVYTTTAALWTTPGTTVTRNVNGVDVTCTSTNEQRAERWGKQTKQQD